MHKFQRSIQSRREQKISARNICANPKIDAVTAFQNSVYVFKGIYYYKIKETGNGIEDNYPRLISEFFPGVNGSVNAVISSNEGYILVFKVIIFYIFRGEII